MVVTHRVSPVAAAELEAQAEASFICTILVFADDSCEPPDLFG
jgi:hypothetical protein